MKIKDLVENNFNKEEWVYWVHRSVHHVPDLVAPKQPINAINWPKHGYFDRVEKPVLVDGEIHFPNKEIRKVTFEVTTPKKEPEQNWVCFHFTTDEEVAISWDSEKWTEVYYNNGRISYGCISVNHKL